ncbi:MAG: hypothetical protein AAF517_04910, partial [Planctomycetota bacterium]
MRRLVTFFAWTFCIGTSVASAQPEFEFHVVAPDEVYGDVDGSAEFEAEIQLETSGLDPGSPGAQAWTVGARAEGGEIIDATVEGTIAAEAPAGLRNTGFLAIAQFREGNCHGDVVCAVVLSFSMPITLDPERIAPVFRVRVETEFPEKEPLGDIRLSIPDTSLCRGGTERFPPAGIAAGRIFVHVMHEGQSYTPRHDSTAVVARRRVQFRRGDVNEDGRVDVSDPIR